MASTFRRNRAASTSKASDGTAAGAADGGGTSSSSCSSSSIPPPPLAGGGGTKAWTGGSVLVSTGLRELDAILVATTTGTGGQPLGSCLYLAQDRRSVLSQCLIRYWCAEALSQEQALLIPVASAADSSSPDLLSATSSWSLVEEEREASSTFTAATETEIQELLHSLPRNLHKDKHQQQQQQKADDGTNTIPPLDTWAEEQDEEEDDDVDEGLVVAWQYRTDIQQERLGLSSSSPSSSNSINSGGGGVRSTGRSRTNARTRATATTYCHSYDLHGRLADQINVTAATTVISMDRCGCACCRSQQSRNLSRNARPCGLAYYRQLVQKVQRSVPEQTTSSTKALQGGVVHRVLFYHPDVDVLAVALPLFLNYIRQHKLPVVVMVAVQSWTAVTASSLVSLEQIRRCADVVLNADSFVDRSQYPPPAAEFRHLHGLLHVRKAATCTLVSAVGHFAQVTVQKRPAAAVYGLKRDRRKLHVTLLHIPPEDHLAESSTGGSVSGGAVRSGAGRPQTKGSTTSSGCGSGGGSSALDF